MTRNLNTLAELCLANSRRWFPDLHTTSKGAAVHFALGLAGEVGELVELLIARPEMTRPPGAEELADVTIYALDFAAEMSIDISILPAAVGRWPQIVIAAGLVCNAAKKANRGDRIDPPVAEARQLIAELFAFAEDRRFDLFREIDRKTAICETRWGGRNG